MRRRTLSGLLAAALLFPPYLVRAEVTTFHLMKIREVFGGTTAAPNAQYVMLQMYAAGQNFTGGHSLFVFDSAGTLIMSFPLHNVSNGSNQAVILIATPDAQTFFGITADTLMAPVINPRGGKICWDASRIDCFSWGNYSGDTVGTGVPFNRCGGLEPGKAARRRTNICFPPTTLDACDDSNNCATDFVFATPQIRNNANQAGTIPPSTCGNGVVEGLEQCDDGNSIDGDGCSSSCQIEPPFCPNAKGDMNGSGDLTAADVVSMLNCVFSNPAGCGLCYTDVNSDGSLSASDVVLELSVVFSGASFPC